jgi:hypothetical protein
VLKAFEKWAKKTAIPDIGMTVDEWLGMPDAELRRMMRDFIHRPLDDLEDAGLLPDAFKGMNPGRKRKGKPAKKAVFDDIPGPQKTAEMREADNAYIRKHQVSRQNPPSSHARLMEPRLRNAHALAMEKASLLQDTAHDDGRLSDVLMSEIVEDSENAGEYFKAGLRGSLARLNVQPGTGTPLLTTLHELGHHVEEVISPQDMRRILAAAQKTSVRRLILGSDLPANDKNYYLSSSEMFARAYAQFVAESSGDSEVANELSRVRLSANAFRVWDRDEFEPVRTAITVALKNLHWL